MKSNLRQFGSWDSKLDAKACEVLALRYAEGSDTFDYTICQRPNGSLYGIAEGKNCIKGRKVDRAAVLGALAKRGIPREVLGKIAKVKDDKKFGKAVQALNSGRKKISADAIKPTKPTAAPKVAPTKPTGEKMTASQRKARLEELRAEREARRGQLQTKRNIRERKKAEEAPKTREEGLDELRKLGFLKNEKLIPRLQKLNENDFSRLIELARARVAEREDIKALSPKQRDVVRSVSGAKKTIKEGGDTAEARQTTKALVELYKNSKTGKSEAGQAEYPPSVAKRYVDFLETGKLAVTKREVSDEELNKVWDSLPGTTRGALKSKGQPPAYIARDDERGKMVLRELLATGFRDEITGQPYNWVDIQPDHKVSIALFKGKKEDIEKNNLVMTHKGYNNTKGRIEGQALSRPNGEEYLKSELVKVFSAQANRSQEAFEKTLNEILTADAVKKGAAKSIVSNSKLWSETDWISNTQTQPAPILQALASSMKAGGPNRFQPSWSQGRNFAPKYASGGFLAPALLLARNIPREKWPEGAWEKSLKALESQIKVAQKKEQKEAPDSGRGYDKVFFERFSKFVAGNGGSVPQEYVDLANGLFI